MGAVVEPRQANLRNKISRLDSFRVNARKAVLPSKIFFQFDFDSCAGVQWRISRASLRRIITAIGLAGLP
ncbi:MAG: hypothetical protein ACKOQM_01690 [Novosphingobium sp.]